MRAVENTTDRKHLRKYHRAQSPSALSRMFHNKIESMRTYPLLAVWLLLFTGCLSTTDNEVVVYTALDREFSEPIFEAFTEKTGIRVLAKYDTESTKTVGLTKAIMAEANRPRCDVFWNNEILNTLRLENRGLLAAYKPKNAADIPDKYRSRTHRWHGFAARARVLIVNTELVPIADYPRTVLQMTNPSWKDKFAIAKPLFGTTATHAAMIFACNTTKDAQQFWQTALANAQVLSGNKQVARAVASGQAAWGLTDTDDAIIEVDNGYPVTIIFPDQSQNDSADEHTMHGSRSALIGRSTEPMGTPLIPNTVGIINGSPNRDQAERLVDYLLSPDVESKLAFGQSAQIPILKSTKAKSRLANIPAQLTDFDVDFSVAVKKWDETATFLREKYIEN